MRHHNSLVREAEALLVRLLCMSSDETDEAKKNRLIEMAARADRRIGRRKTGAATSDCCVCGGSGGGFRPQHCRACKGTGRKQ